MSRSSRTCRRAAEVRWTVETHPTLIYCRSRQHVLGSLVANLHQYDLAAPDAADAVAHINDLLRTRDGGIVTPIYYWACLNTEIAPSHASSIRKLMDAGADVEKRSTYRGHADTLLIGLVRQHSSLITRDRSNLPIISPLLARAATQQLADEGQVAALPGPSTVLPHHTEKQGVDVAMKSRPLLDVRAGIH